MTAESLYQAAITALPNPKNPKTGDTYQLREGNITLKIVVLSHHQQIGTRCYVNGVLRDYERFDLWLSSISGITPIIGGEVTKK